MKLSHSETLALFRNLIPSRRLRWAINIGFWVAIGTLSAVFWRLFPPGDYPYTWWELHRVKIVLWLIWGAFTPVILEFAGRYRIEAPHIVRNAMVIAIGSIVGTFVYLVVYTAILLLNLLGADHGNTVGEMFDFVVSVHASFYLLAFLAMVMIEHALGYYRAYHGQKLQAARLETQLAESQLTSLRLQLQPHFLFNSLHALGALVRKGDTKRAVDMLNGISELLRASLSGVSRSEITLGEELELLEHYLAIVRLRFGDQLIITQAFGDDTSNAMVPGFLLQPIVENAVRHGIERTGGTGTIHLSAEKRKGSLIFVVENSGSGNGVVSPKAGHEGIGLSNTAARLQTLYGRQQRVSLESTPSGGARATIELPFHEHSKLSHTV